LFGSSHGIDPEVPEWRRSDPMGNFRDVLRQFEFHVLILLFGLIGFSWPFMSAVEKKHPVIILIYLFFIWTILVFLLFLISRSIGATEEEDEEERS
jgi:hypothetical protein